MPSLGDMVVRITGDTRGFDRAIGDVRQKSSKLGGMMSNALSYAGGTLLAGGVSFLGTKMLDVGRSAVMMASDLTEVQNVVDVTFGKSAGQINNWSQTVTKGFGLSELQAKKMSGSMGAMLKSSGIAETDMVKMSTRLTELAGDFASFYNLDHDAAWIKIRSGISGETEPLKELGINMSVANMEAYALSQGITKSWQSMTQAEQTLLRYNYLMTVSKDAQGDFARTSGGFANQLRLLETQFGALTASIGVMLIPALTDALKWMNGLIESFKGSGSGINDMVKSAMPLMDSFKKSFENLYSSVAPIISALTDLYMSNKVAIDAMLSATIGAINGVVNALGPFIVALVKDVEAVTDLYKAINDIKNLNFKSAFGNIQSAGSNLSQALGAAGQGTKNLYTGFESGYKATQSLLNPTTDYAGSYYANKYGGVPRYASGTSYHPGGLAIVGERGPELLNLPRGSQVIPMSGAGVQISVTGNYIAGDYDVDRIAAQITKKLKLAGVY
jgi:hypothetical protein